MPQLLEGSFAWWLDRLNARLNDKKRRDRLTKLDDYYRGRHPLLFATEEFKEIFADVIRPLSINFVSLVVDASVERLRIQGFKAGDATQAATDAHDIWQANDMDAWSVVAHREALAKSECALIVWTGPDGKPTISVEDARTVLVDYAPGRITERNAALKRWADEKKAYATLYLADGIYKFEQELNADQKSAVINGSSVGIIDTAGGQWKRREVDGEPWPLPNPTGVVPVIPMVNRPDLFGMGQSEMEPVLPQQDAINKLGCDLIIASEFAAFPQRWMTGVETRDAETNEDTFDMRAAIDRILTVGDPAAKMGIFEAADLSNYSGAIEMFVQQMASISHTPPHYLLGRSGVIPSGEATTSAESGLVSKVRSHQDEKGPVWGEVMRVAALTQDREDGTKLAPIWADPERRSWSELADALAKERTLGIPDKYLWKKLGYSTDDIAEIERLRDEESERLVRSINPGTVDFDPERLDRLVEIYGKLVRAGDTPDSAAERAGLPQPDTTGQLPVTTRPPDAAPGF